MTVCLPIKVKLKIAVSQNGKAFRDIEIKVVEGQILIRVYIV